MWLDDLKDMQKDIEPAMKFTGKEEYIPTTVGTYAMFWKLFGMDRLIAIAELLEKIVEDGTGSPEGKRTWPLRAAYGREARKLLSDTQEKE